MGGRPRSRNAMTSKERKEKYKNEKKKRKASQNSMFVRSGGGVIRQKTDASQTNTDSFDVYNKSVILTRVLPYMDTRVMSAAQCASREIHQRILELLERMYPHFEGYKKSVASYQNFLTKTCLVCRKNRTQFNSELNAFVHKKCIRNFCVNTYYLDRKGAGYELKYEEYKHLPRFEFSGWTGRRSYSYDAVWKEFHPVLDPRLTVQSITHDPLRVTKLNAVKIANQAAKAAKNYFKDASSSVTSVKKQLADARREKKQKAREERLKRRMAGITRWLKQKKVNLTWKDCDDVYLDVMKMFPACCEDFFHTTRLQVKFTATKFKARLPTIHHYFQSYGKLLEYEVRTGQTRSWNDDVEAQNTSLAIRNASFMSLCAARDVGSILDVLKRNIFEDRMKILGAQVSKLESSSSRQAIQQNTSMRPLEGAKRVQSLMEEYYPLCCGDYFTMKFLCDVDTDMIIDRYIKLKGYLSSSPQNRTTMRSLVIGGVRMPWVEDMKALELNLTHEVAKLAAKDAAIFARRIQQEMRNGIKWYGRKIRPGVCMGRKGKQCKNIPSSTCSMRCCKRCCDDRNCPRHGKKKRWFT